MLTLPFFKPGTLLQSLYHIINSAYDEIIWFTLRSINYLKKNGSTPLHEAIRWDASAELIVRLIERGADVNAMNKDRETILHNAAWNGHYNLVIRLIENGADVNAVNHEGQTALHYATLGFHAAIVAILIKNGANIHHTNRYKMTALHYATLGVHDEIVTQLIESGIKVNEMDSDGMTPLHYAFESGDDEIAARLIAAILVENVDNQKPDYLNEARSLSVLWDVCRAEVNALHQLTFGASSLVHFYKENDANKLAAMSQNEILNGILTQPDFKNHYPRYADKMLANFQKGLTREKALTTAFNSIFKFNENRTLNPDCWKKILGYLSQKDLESIAQVAFLFFKQSNDNVGTTSAPTLRRII